MRNLFCEINNRFDFLVGGLEIGLVEIEREN